MGAVAICWHAGARGMLGAASRALQEPLQEPEEPIPCPGGGELAEAHALQRRVRDRTGE